MPREVIVREPPYFCNRDEESFCTWLESISAFESLGRGPKGGLIALKFKDAEFTVADWVDLLGLCARYSIDVRPLRDLVTPKHAKRLKNPKAYWYAQMWGPPGSPLRDLLAP